MKTTLLFSGLLPFFLFGQSVKMEQNSAAPSAVHATANLEIPAAAPMGCLDAPYGQYPLDPYTPECVGVPKTITDVGWAGEFSVVNVVAGTEYKFLVSNPTYYITVANDDGTAVFAEGTGIVTWTATLTGEVRFYVHTNSSCGYGSLETQHIRSIQCGTPPQEPTYGCDQNYSGISALANNITKNLNFAVANDFFVPKESLMYRMKSITVHLLPLAGGADIASLDIKIMNDSGTNTPGTVVYSMTNVVPSSVVLSSDIYAGYETYDVTLDMADYMLPVNSATPTRYWISLQANSASVPAQSIFWMAHNTLPGWLTASNYQSADNGATYTQIQYMGERFDSTWSIDAECALIATNEAESQQLTYYPNPVKDVLTIHAKIPVASVHVSGINGQKMQLPTRLQSGKIDMSRLNPGVYVVTVILESGKTESFKVIKK